MPISCHFRDCKALLVTSQTRVSGAIYSKCPDLHFYILALHIHTNDKRTISLGDVITHTEILGFCSPVVSKLRLIYTLYVAVCSDRLQAVKSHWQDVIEIKQHNISTYTDPRTDRDIHTDIQRETYRETQAQTYYFQRLTENKAKCSI